MDLRGAPASFVGGHVLVVVGGWAFAGGDGGRCAFAGGGGWVGIRRRFWNWRPLAVRAPPCEQM